MEVWRPRASSDKPPRLICWSEGRRESWNDSLLGVRRLGEGLWLQDMGLCVCQDSFGYKDRNPGQTGSADQGNVAAEEPMIHRPEEEPQELGGWDDERLAESPFLSVAGRSFPFPHGRKHGHWQPQFQDLCRERKAHILGESSHQS